MNHQSQAVESTIVIFQNICLVQLSDINKHKNYD